MAASCDDAGSAVVASPRRKVLMAVDESEESMYALSWAIDNLIVPRQSQSEGGTSSDVIVLLHVQTHPHVFVGAGAGPGFYIAPEIMTPEVMDTVRKHQEEVSKEILLRAKILCDKKHLDTETMVAIGDPRDAICETVEKLHTHYLIVGSHGYGAFKRAFLGSVSDYCAHNAKCPVIIVKKP